MSEIVPAEPVYYDAYDSDDSYDRAIKTSSDIASSSYDDHDHVFEPFESEKVPRTLPDEIRRFLRVANLIETEEPRIAHLCRFHALEVAHNTDRNSNGRGVRQFKTSLLQRLIQDEEITHRKRKEMSDIRELRRVYYAYKDYINRHGGAYDLGIKDREKLMNACRIASVLFEVLKTMTNSVGHQAKLYVPYNILPLDHGGIQHAIMQLPEIKAAVAAVRNVRGLPLNRDVQKPGALVDIFDFLLQYFGFQEGNAANQREHLILLLANTHVRRIDKQTSILKLGDEAIDKLMKKFFKNYTKWCKFLGQKSNMKLPYVKQEAQQYKLLYIGLYLLIWGEAANLRFMPECISYIFHHMAHELHGILTSAVSLTTWQKVEPAYGGEPESFLKKVVTPIYTVIRKEAEKSNNGTPDHSKWRNYDDLNEYFWSPDCFQIGWPMRITHDFFFVQTLDKNGNEDPHSSHSVDGKDKLIGNTDKDLGLLSVSDTSFLQNQDSKEKNREGKWLGKTNFVETRSFWQIYRTFDRLWNLLILCLQAMIIMACHDLKSPLQLFDAVVFEDVISIFITSAFLNLIQGILDIAFTWKARNMLDYYQKIKLVLKLFVAVIWTIILPVCYSYSRRKYTCYPTHYEGWLGEMCFSPYMVSVAIYLATNAVEMVLFLVPAVRKYIEISNWRIFLIFTWWTKPRLYIGRGMQESQLSVFKYTLFWILVLSSKFAFSYNFEIKPLIEPTRQIMEIGMKTYDWHEFFPEVKSNAGAIVAIWAPIIVIYFMDTQIWYSVYCSIFGGIYGILHHLGEIRTLGMFRSRFNSLPSAFNACLIPPSTNKNSFRSNIFRKRDQKGLDTEKNGIAKFSLVWNQIISKYRSEDLISNREFDLMIIPLSADICTNMVRWPVYLLANKFSTASSMARDFVGQDKSLFRKIKKDEYMKCAVTECYESLKYILNILVIGELEKKVISSIVNKIEESIERSNLLENFKMRQLPALQSKCIELLQLLLEKNEHRHGEVVEVLQDMFELVTNDMMVNSTRLLDFLSNSQDEEADLPYFSRRIEPQLFESTETKNSINFPLPDTSLLYEQIKRFLLLLTVKDKAMDVPANLEARRRISFFATSLFMDMPSAPKLRSMLSFSVITPHYMEDINYSLEELHSSKEEVPIIYYMQKIYPDEWENFLERVGCYAINDDSMEKELRNWASFRGQTLSRTVRGMMYYRDAIKLQAFLDMADDKDILVGLDEVEKNNHTLSAQLDALADMKFTYVISCQMYGSQTQEILDLLIRYPSLRVAFVEEKEIIGSKEPLYSSLLVKAADGLEEIYRIKLPGPPNLGEGKPENQNNAIVFTRGEALQTIDMNQDMYLEEAFKMRNLLQEFQHQGTQPPTILGLREHIFTGSVSSLAWFMSYQETSFVTIGQRILANPLRVRFHYGHPDVFDRLFHITRGGVSKASKTINLSEDVFAGFNSTLRRGSVTYHEYLQVGKGRDVGLNQISKFEAKVANGNSEQTISRDLYRLARGFDYFRMLSCYYTTIGFYFNSLIAVIGVYVFLYGQLYLVLSGLQRALIVDARVRNIQSLETALASQSFIQLGLLTGLPMVMEIGLEKGFLMALKDFVLMQLQLAAVFFTFSLGTKSHHYGRTILHGGAKYRPTGRKVVVFHASFTENYRLYSRSHFVKGFELLLLLVIYDLFRRSYQSSMAFVLITYAIWFMSITWLFAPFLFNPSGFSWGKIVDDWKDWNKWIKQQGGLGIQEDKSWQSWWNDEQAHLRRSGLFSRLIEIIFSLRFFIYQYGLVYHLDISKQNKNFLVYALSWVVILAMFLLVKAVSMGRKLFSARYHLMFRFFKAFLFLGVLTTIISLSVACDLSSKDLVICCLAFLPTGWGWILFAQAIRPKIEHTGLWEFTQVLAKSYDFGMGVVLLAPIAILAWLPIIQAFHFRFLFNEAFNRHLQIQQILSDRTKNK